jgi:DNA-binding XRE family transcriptional regulator
MDLLDTVAASESTVVIDAHPPIDQKLQYIVWGSITVAPMPWTVNHLERTVNGMKYDDIIASFGARVRELRIKQGYSQEAFAQECEIDRSYYGRIERSDANPTLRNIAAIADALGVSIPDLFANLPSSKKRTKRP